MRDTPFACSVTDAVDITSIHSKSSPQEVSIRHQPLKHNNQHEEEECVGSSMNLPQLVREIETQLNEDKSTPINKQPVFRNLLERYVANRSELERFVYVDPTKNYTRNLIATDHETYALILIVWNRAKYSPIHDHPCDGCWVKVIDGTINEVQYQHSAETPHLVETSNRTLSEGVTYMDDSIGLHKIGNPRNDCDAITLHLYSPPYDKCRIWFDPNDAAKSSVAYSYYFSEFGERADY